MDFTLNAEQTALRDRIVRFAREHLNDGVIERDRTETFPRDLWQLCGREGLLGLFAPTEHGGGGLDPVSTAVALEAFGYACLDGGLGFSIGAHLFTGVMPVMSFGTEAQKRRYLRGLCDGTLIGVNAMTEPGAGSDPFGMTTTAERDGDGWRLNGAKKFISHIPGADMTIVYAVTDAAKGFHGGQSAFIVDAGAAGMTTRPIEKMGLRTSPLGEITLENVRVGPESLLGELGGGGVIFMSAMDWERACLLATHVGTMQRLLDSCVKHARTRRAFGEPIGKFQAISHRIADMRVRLEAARLLTYNAAAKLGKTRSVGLDAAMSKLFVSEAYVQTALDAVQIHGAAGYVTENHIERTLRDAIASRLYSGTSEMQRNIIARWLGM